jgi:hypothetical protein
LPSAGHARLRRRRTGWARRSAIPTIKVVRCDCLHLQRLTDPRATTSLTKWTVTQRRLIPAGMASFCTPTAASMCSRSCANSKRLASARRVSAWDFSLRQDLQIRERETRGTPRVFSVWHRHRRIFYNPNTLSKREALRRYDVAHP